MGDVTVRRIKYLFIIAILLLLSICLYKNYIYYKLPYNPISHYATTSNGFHITKNLTDGTGITLKTHDLNTCNLIFKYFSGLKLVPLKDKLALDSINKQKNRAYFSCTFGFNELNYLFVNEIYLNNLNVIYISSNKPGFNRGYYKIIDSKFNYNYVNRLITNSKK